VTAPLWAVPALVIVFSLAAFVVNFIVLIVEHFLDR